MIKNSQVKSPRRLSIFATGLPSGAEYLELEEKSQICRTTSKTPSWYDSIIFNQMSSLFNCLIKLKGYLHQSILNGPHILNSTGQGANPQVDIIQLLINAANGKSIKLFNILLNKLTVRNTRNAEGRSKLSLFSFLFAQCYIPKCCS